MPSRVPLPPALTWRAFTTREANDVGVGRGRLAGRDLHSPYRGVRTAIELAPAQAYSPLLRTGDRFSHTTAAALWGCPLPEEHERAVHVTSTSPTGRPRAEGVVGHEGLPAQVVVRNGLPVSHPALTLVECATLLPLDDLVVIGDHLVLDPRVLDPLDIRPHITLSELHSELEGMSAAGVRLARRAARLIRDGVESPMETRLRLLLVRAGLPRPVCGLEVTGARGRTIGWFDLAWPEFRVIAEYDGDGHRTSREQYDRDIRRFDLADDAGWKVIRVRAPGLWSRSSETVQRVSTALRSRGWSPPRRKRS